MIKNSTAVYLLGATVSIANLASLYLGYSSMHILLFLLGIGLLWLGVLVEGWEDEMIGPEAQEKS